MDWERPRPAKKPKQPKKSSGGGTTGAMLILAWAMLAVPVSAILTVAGYIAWH